MTPMDYLLMIIVMVAVCGAGLYLWERFVDPPMIKKYDGVGAWAKDSSTPPWGWPISIGLGIAVFGLLLFGPTLAARFIGA